MFCSSSNQNYHQLYQCDECYIDKGKIRSAMIVIKPEDEILI